MSVHKEWCLDYRLDCEFGGVYNGPVPCTCERRSGERRERPQNDDPTTWRRGHPPYGGPHRRQQERRA